MCEGKGGLKIIWALIREEKNKKGGCRESGKSLPSHFFYIHREFSGLDLECGIKQVIKERPFHESNTEIQGTTGEKRTIRIFGDH